jgi:hypothetical protein
MMRRISLVAASAAMLALSALPASAATMGSATAATTHKLSFPAMSGLKAWGTYTKVSKGLKLNICAEDMSRSIYAVGAVAEASNSTGKFHTNLGAVAFGYHQTICRNMTVRFSSHLNVYSFDANNKGMMTHKSKLKKIF